MKDFYFLLISLILSSCTSVDSEFYEFDPRAIGDDQVFLSDIASDIKYIPLDNSIPVNRFIDIAFGSNDIIISSADIGLLRYDLAGKLLNRIGSIGRGPSEYTFYMYFGRDNRTGNVYNLSDRNKTIKVFSKEGHLVRDFKLNEVATPISAIIFFNSNIFIQLDMQFDYNDFEWIVCDTFGQVLKTQKRHLPKFSANISGTGRPYIFDNRITYYNTWTDTIYSVDKDFQEKPIITVKPGDHRFPRDYVPIDHIFQKKYFGITKLIETRRYFLFKYYYQGYTMAFVDKKTWRTSKFQYEWDESVGGHPISGMVNDFDSGSWFLPNYYYSWEGDEYLIGIQYPYQIIARAASKEFKDSNPIVPSKKLEFEKLAASLKETDNPVLVLVRLKD